MTKKEFAKWEKANPITFSNGVNGVVGTIVINGYTYTWCSASDKGKRFQKKEVKERLTARIKEVLGVEE